MYIVEKLHKYTFIGLCINNEFTIMHDTEHTKFLKERAYLIEQDRRRV